MNLLAFTKYVCVNGVEFGSILEFLKLRYGCWVLQTDLRAGNYQGLPEVSQHLASQNMEVIGRHGGLSNLEIDVLRSKVVKSTIFGIVGLRVDILKESLDMASGVLRSCTIKAMRQK